MLQIQVTALESAGDLQLNGVDVALNDVISKADIDLGLLKFVPAPDANGAGYDSLQFIVHDGIHVRFVHSSYVEPHGVVSETALASSILASSRYRVVGSLSSDTRLTERWLEGARITTRGR